MKRRAALLALACSAGAARCFAASATAAPPAAALWGDGGLWAVTAGGAPQRLALPAQTHAATAPAPTPVPGGLWAPADEHQLQGWRAGSDGRWTVVASALFDDPVHAWAASADGRFVFAAHGQRLALLDAAGSLLRSYEGSDLGGRRHGRAGAIVAHAGRRSVLVAWPALGELWEISLDPAAPPIFDGLVHDYRMAEAIATPGYLGARRAPLDTPMPAPEFCDARVPWIAGRVGDRVAVVHLDVRRRIAEMTLPGAQPAAALLRRVGAAWRWWLPVDDALQEIDTARWQPLARHALPAAAGQADAAPRRVRALQALGDVTWLLLDDPAHGGLWTRRAGEWLAVNIGPGRPLAMQADAAGERLLLATAAPTRLVVLGRDGGLLHEWPLPDAGVPAGVCWLPAAA